jgi:hypothetical protein
VDEERGSRVVLGGAWIVPDTHADYAVNPFPLGEATARLIARSFVNASVPPLPPLKRLTDDPHDTKIGCPAEFDNQDAWLTAIGEVSEAAASERMRRVEGEEGKERSKVS